ncbi:MAG: PTS sugar transporter subunit IIA [Gammaproteobacteria bacterium]|nr:PTS sugar transporter subunit IIA [Gammaproteobacteria bacterium]MBU1656144.1 PTS sugar transporter subunit IIA [Gammaproteobacteria bacterium]MBU1960788.1 PTS sugar transporter subunit IIA [Gammaproteobacteria bacterium]
MSLFPEDFLTQDRVEAGVRAASKKRALESIATLLERGDGTEESRSVFDRLLERERLGSTGLGHGVALPHARTPGLTRARGAFIRLAGPIDYDTIDREPVDLVFGLLVPEQATSEHLQLLAKLASLFSDPNICSALRMAPDSESLLSTLLAQND